MKHGRRFLAALSGEHPTLPAAEFKAAMEAEGFKFHPAYRNGRLVAVDVEEETPLEAASRCGMLKALALELFTCPPDPDCIADSARGVDLSQLASEAESFVVRVWRLGGGSPSDVEILESMLGRIIVEMGGFKVELKKPRLVFIGFMADDLFAFGLKVYEKPPHLLEARMPKRRLAVHPSTMDPKLARCMVNLSRARRGGKLLDPFCGVGGILLEAASIGCRVVGCDVNSRMASGCLMNLKQYGLQPIGVALADAAHMPFEGVDAVATDPPYGTAASTLKRGVRTVLKDFLPQAAQALPSGGYAAVAAPKGAGLAETAEAFEFEVVGLHEVYIHRRLTREIASLRRV